ncbi:MAG: RidA family protein [Rhodobacteraceae bacterium]|nr:RidA family protein [Paracoccaceae bacterium]
MSGRISVSSGSPLEPEIGFCRAVRVGNSVSVAGTAPMDDDGNTVGTGDVYAQTRRCIEIVAQALCGAGAGLGDVVRTRIMLVDIDEWKDAARAHGEVFADIRPVCTFVEVSRFIHPEWRVEVEADAIVQENTE